MVAARRPSTGLPALMLTYHDPPVLEGTGEPRDPSWGRNKVGIGWDTAGKGDDVDIPVPGPIGRQDVRRMVGVKHWSWGAPTSQW